MHSSDTPISDTEEPTTPELVTPVPHTCYVGASQFLEHELQGLGDPVPYMLLRGPWLRPFGFGVGAKVQIEMDDGLIKLRMIATPQQARSAVPRNFQQQLRDRARRAAADRGKGP